MGQLHNGQNWGPLRYEALRRLSGFRLELVGLLVGFLSLPDKDRSSAFNRLRAICRVCRVLLGVERSGETAVAIAARGSFILRRYPVCNRPFETGSCGIRRFARGPWTS